MESSREGIEGAGGPPKRLGRTWTIAASSDAMDPEVVPSSLAVIAPILRVANEVEESDPRVAYLCRFYAFDKAHKLDPTSEGRGVRQFKTALLHKLEKDDVTTRDKRKATSDAREIQDYYQNYYNKYVKSLENNIGVDRGQLVRTYQTAAVLFDVLKAVNQTDLDPQIEQAGKEVEAKKEIYVEYNILPLDPTSASEPIMMFPEVSPTIFDESMGTQEDIEARIRDALEDIYRMLHRELESIGRRVTRARSRVLSELAQSRIDVPSTSSMIGCRRKVCPRRRASLVAYDDIGEADFRALDMVPIRELEYDDEGNLISTGDIPSSSSSSEDLDEF